MKFKALILCTIFSSSLYATEDLSCNYSDQERLDGLAKIRSVVRNRMYVEPDQYYVAEASSFEDKGIIVIKNLPETIADTYVTAYPETNEPFPEVKAAHLLSACSVKSEYRQCIWHLFEDISYCYNVIVPAAVSGDVDDTNKR